MSARTSAATLPATLPATVVDLGLRRTAPLPGEVLRWSPAAGRAITRGALALDLASVTPSPPPQLSVLPDQDAQEALRARARRFLQALVEIAGADRPVSQLLRWATPEVYAEVARRADVAVSATDAKDRALTGRPRVVSVHVSQPATDVAEVSGHVRHAGRSRALAARLEHRRDRWVCTALQWG